MILSAIIVTLVMIPLSVTVVMGKGDALIAGYNMLDAEKRARYNVKRLRVVVASFMLVVAMAFWLPFFVGGDGKGVFVSTFSVVLVATFVAVILLNGWAKRG